MATLIFITHPHVHPDPEKPREEWQLSDQGKAEVERLLKMPFWQKIEKVYSSTEAKAFSVAEIIANHHEVPVKKIKGLEEIDRSATGFIDEEKYRLAIEDFYLHPADSYKGWETAYDATERVKSCMDKIAKQDADGYIVVIGHGLIGSCLSCYIKGIDPVFNEDNDILGSFLEFDWTDKKVIQDWTKY